MPIQLTTPDEIERILAQRVRQLRLLAGWKQSTLAIRAGVSLPTLRRYERTGRTSLSNFLRLCHALGHLDELASFLRSPEARTMAELEERAHRSHPRRGRR